MKKNTLASSPLKSYVTLVPEESREDVATSVIKTISIQTKLSFPNGRFFRENKLFLDVFNNNRQSKFMIYEHDCRLVFLRIFWLIFKRT